MARWTPTSPVGWRFGWITVVSTCQTTSSRQIRYWGIHPSFGFVEEPETNGVAERWNRTLKEQAIHGRIFQNLEAVRAAVADFVERYNQTWRLEKLGYQTPIEAREEYELCQAGIAQMCVQGTGCGTEGGVLACASRCNALIQANRNS